MNTIDCITSRRSIRIFQDKKPPHSLLEQIVAAAAYAPSWKNTQITRYVFIENDEIKSKIATACDFAYNQNTMRKAPVLTAITMIKNRSGYERDGSFSTEKGTGWQMFDAGIASQTFCLAAHEHGLGTVIMGIFNQKETEKLLNLPEDRELAALIALGYPAEEPPAPRRKTTDDLMTFL